MTFLWSIDKIPAETSLKEFVPFLSRPEREKARQITSSIRQKEFICGRFLLRQVFKQELGQELPEVLKTNEHGKPLSPFKTSFSLSHSSGWVGLAVDSENPVGFDMEKDDGKRDVDRVITRYGSPGEVEWIRSLTESSQRESFYKLWCLKESFGKATGEGLTDSLKDLEFDLSKGKLLSVPQNQICQFHYARSQGLHLAVCSLGKAAFSPKWLQVKAGLPRLRWEELKETSLEEVFSFSSR